MAFLFAAKPRIYWLCANFDFAEPRSQPHTAASLRGCAKGLKPKLEVPNPSTHCKANSDVGLQAMLRLVLLNAERFARERAYITGAYISGA